MKGRFKLDIPKYVSESCLSYLKGISGSSNPKIKAVVADIRTREAWLALLKADIDDFEAARFVGEIINAANRDYTKLRQARRDFVDSCKRISRKASDLADELSALDRKYYFDESVGSFHVLNLTSIDWLLFESNPVSTSQLESAGLVDSEAVIVAWKLLRHWVCPSAFFDRSDLKWSNSLTAMIPDDISDPRAKSHYDEPTEETMSFLDNAWSHAPRLPDILRRVSEITASESQISFDHDADLEATLISRKSSQKRDYLRALWSRLFRRNPELLYRMQKDKQDLYLMIANFGTVALELKADDEISEADVRQTLKMVLPYLEKWYVEVFGDDEGGPQLDLLHSWFE